MSEQTPPAAPQPANDRYVELALIRHGMSVENGGGAVQGRGDAEDNVLHAHGELQAAHTAEDMRSAGLHPVEIHTTRLPRAHQTATIIRDRLATGQDIATHNELLELSKGDLEGRPRDEVESDPEYQRGLAELGWDFRYGRDVLDDSGNVIRPAETMREVGARSFARLCQIATEHALPADAEIPEGTRPVLAVIGHGMNLRAAMGHALGLSIEETNKLKMGNGDIRVVRIYPGRPEGQQLELGEYIKNSAPKLEKPQA